MKLFRYVVAAFFGVALGFAAVTPVQAARYGAAVCARDAGAIYEQMKAIRGWDYEDIDTIATQYLPECDSSSVRGAYYDQGAVHYVVLIGNDVYVLTYDPFGTLLSVR